MVCSSTSVGSRHVAPLSVRLAQRVTAVAWRLAPAEACSHTRPVTPSVTVPLATVNAVGAMGGATHAVHSGLVETPPDDAPAAALELAPAAAEDAPAAAELAAADEVSLEAPEPLPDAQAAAHATPNPNNNQPHRLTVRIGPPRW